MCTLIRWSGASMPSLARAAFGSQLLARVVLLLAATGLNHVALASQPLPGAQNIASGAYHNCAIVNGGAQCWGDNVYGELGDGTFENRSAPVPVRGLASGVTAIAGGGFHTCAIVNGAVKCWGRNPDGELGDGTVVTSATPVAVLGLSTGVVAISAGLYHTCAVISGGSVRCWGWNSNGQLGDNTTNATNSGPPVAVSGVSNGAMALAAGGYHTCAIVNGGAQCWGYNANGELSNGTVVDSHAPVAVNGLSSGVTTMAAGLYHTCAVVSGGAARCWGSNSNGQLGDNTTAATNAGPPVAVSGLNAGTTALAAGYLHTCAVVNGSARCWGYNHWGQLGDGQLQDSHVPIAVSGLTSGVNAIASGANHACAQVVSGGQGKTQCWGFNFDGELGQGDALFQSRPIAVSGLGNGVTTLASSALAQHSCAVVNGGGVCWGYNFYGQLGDGTATDRFTPVSVTGLTSGVTAMGNGSSHSCAVIGGRVACWGGNANGQLGNNTTTDSETPVTAIAAGATAIAVGDSHTCAIVGTSVKCWGSNGAGQLGNGTLSESHVPVAVIGLAGAATSITLGRSHSCAIIAGGTIQCWGYNSNGQLGNGTTNSTNAGPPVTVANIPSGASAVAAGGYHTCAIVNGGAQCWGWNAYGALGNAQTLDSHVPVAVSGLSSAVTAVATGSYHTCAVANGAAYCWGSNFNGELGDGTAIDHIVPAGVSGLTSGVSRIGAGLVHACAVVNGAEKCWGSDSTSQLGDGRADFIKTPVVVVQGDEIFGDGFEAN